MIINKLLFTFFIFVGLLTDVYCVEDSRNRDPKCSPCNHDIKSQISFSHQELYNIEQQKNLQQYSNNINNPPADKTIDMDDDTIEVPYRSILENFQKYNQLSKYNWKKIACCACTTLTGVAVVGVVTIYVGMSCAFYEEALEGAGYNDHNPGPPCGLECLYFC